MEPMVRVELTTSALRKHCSTTELHRPAPLPDRLLFRLLDRRLHSRLSASRVLLAAPIKTESSIGWRINWEPGPISMAKPRRAADWHSEDEARSMDESEQKPIW